MDIEQFKRNEQLCKSINSCLDWVVGALINFNISPRRYFKLYQKSIPTDRWLKQRLKKLEEEENRKSKT